MTRSEREAMAAWFRRAGRDDLAERYAPEPAEEMTVVIRLRRTEDSGR